MSLVGLGAKPASRAQSRLDDLYGVRPAGDQSPMAAFEAVSRKTRVPVNVLLALDEGRGDLKAAESNATRLASAVAEGKPIEAAITDLAGDEARGTAILQTAYRLADQLDPPAPLAPDRGNDGKVGAGEALGGLGRDVATGAVRATGGAIEALGIAADEALRFGNDPATDGPTVARTGGRAAGSAVRGIGDAMAEGRSEDYKQVRAGTQPGGDITDPSSWTLGEDPSLLGLMGVAAEGVGSMAPLVAAPSARVAAVFGGLMGAGEGAQNGRKFVEDAAKTLDENGRPEIAKLPEYRALTEGGMDPAKAVEELSRQAENSAGFRQGLIASIGGAATNRIMRGAEGWLGQGGRLTRAVKKGATGAVEEGAQEVAEGAASGLGIEAATGADVNPLADSFGNFVGGAMAGGGMGVGAGAVSRGEEPARRPEPQPETPPPLLGLPAPDPATPQPGGALVSAPRQITQDPTYRNPNFSFPALPAPDAPLGAPPVQPGPGLVSAPRQITHNPDVQNPNWSFPTGSPATPSAGRPLGLPAPMIPADGSGADQAAAPVLSPPSLGTGAVAPELGMAPPAPAAPPVHVAGPVEAIAQKLQASLPAPAPEPPLRFPDQKPGGAISLGREDGATENAVFMGETPEGAVVRIAGREVALTPEQFDRARDQAEINEAKLKEGTANVEPRSAEAGADQRIDTPGVGDGRGDGGQGIEAGGPALEAGVPGSDGLDRQPAAQQPGNGSAGSGDLGDVDVADGTGELGGPLTPTEIAPQSNPEVLTVEPGTVAAAALEADPEPTEAQKEKGNYRKGHARWNGLDLTIENAKGSERRGKGPDGTEWSVTMPADYGYFRKSEGADGDHVDFYMGPNEAAPAAFIIDQVDAETGAYDEHKVMLGFDSAAEARAAHEAAFSDGKGAARMGGITKMAVPDLKEWLKTGDTKKPVSRKLKAAAQPDPIRQPDPSNVKEADDAPIKSGHGFLKTLNTTKGAAKKGKLRAAATADYLTPGNIVRSYGGGVDRIVSFDPETRAVTVQQLIKRDGEWVDDPTSPQRTHSTLPDDRALANGPIARAPMEPATPAPQRRPFTSYVARSFGGINPGGKAAEELRHRGITARTAPGLFRRGGRRELDNIVADEHPDLAGAIARADDGMYLSPQAIIDAIVDEVAGAPLAYGRHAEDQQAARDVQSSRRAVEAEDAAPIDTGVIPDPERDIRDPEERLAEIERMVDEDAAEIGISLTTAERAGIIDIINRQGGFVPDAIHDFFVRGVDNAVREAASDGSAAGEVSGIPFGDEGEAGSAGPDAGADGRPGAEGDGAGSPDQSAERDVRAAADESGLDQPATEPGADGLPQTILPGMEGGEDQRQSSLTAKQRAEIEARQQQSKARRLDGNTSDAGPLFDEQDALFQRDMSEPVATLTGDELGEWEDIRQLGKKAEAWYRNNLVGKDPVTNDETGWSIQFDGTGARKTSGRKGDVLYRLVPAIPAILENGRLISSEADSRGRDEIRAVHKLAARVSMGGREYSVIATIREKTDGTYHYDLSMDREASGFSTATVQEQRSRTSALEGGPADLNLGLADAEVNHSDGERLTPADARAVNAVANEALTAVGIERAVSVQAGANTGGANASYRRGVISILRPGGNWKHALDHEIIHALRDPALWNRSHGLFSADEWRALVRAARADKAIRSRVEAAYPDLDTAGQTEEMVAELYADWAQGRRDAPTGPLRAAFERIASFFRAVASALRGEGFQSAAMVMERIASGEIGGRGPDGPGRANEAFRKWFGDSKAVDANGEPLVVHHGTRSMFEAFAVAPRKARRTGDGDASKGFFFTTNPQVAESYAADDTLGDRARRQLRMDKPHVEDVYLSIQNPYEFDMRGSEYDGRIYSDVIDTAKEAGHDGVVIRNVVDDGYTDTDQVADVWIAFRPSQIKSISNQGTFDPADDRIRYQRDMSAFVERFNLSNPVHRARGLIGNLHWKRTPKEAAGWMSNLLTDAMGKDARFNALGLVPGRALFTELARNLPAAQDYLALKEKMDAMRNDWQVKSSAMVDSWTKTARKNPKANQALMEIMHESTLAGLDPSKDDGWHRPIDEEARKMLEGKPSPAQSEWARITLAQAEERQQAWQELRGRFEKLPKPFRDLYVEIRDGYSDMADGMDNALIENIRAMSKVIVKKADREYRKEMDRIRDEGLTGDAKAVAVDKANEKRTAAHARAARGTGSRLQQMRQTFESNRLSGPYFPLARFGNYFVTIRDENGKVTSFSRFETEREQQAWVEQSRKDGLGTVQAGVLGGDVNLREQVDPRFLADVEELLTEAGASKEMMDQVWQRWLETLPDQSVRTNKIHRKGRAGFNRDAIRSFASSMFHGAHQMARLQYGAQMEEALAEAEEQASHRPDANRAGFVVREMRQRHQFTMAPTNNPWVTKATSLAFVWYLGVSPAAALVNLSQTTVVGVPMMAARYRKGGAAGAIKELSRASADFMRGRGAVLKKIGGIPVSTGTWTVENAPNLSAEERQAMEQGYQRGVIDKTQAHDLASVADSGVEYNPRREKVMRVIGWGFHHAERFNREVTYLASYRMARAEGADHATAIESAANMTWRVHFDYSNSSRPRAMTGDAAKVFTIFKNFQVNMLFRLFRDAHQSLHAADAETKREARLQLAGVTLSLMAHAGIRGVWGYALLTTLLSWFMPGADDGDDIDEWLQDALLMEGDGVGTAAWNFIMATALNGAPGHLTGIDLTNRIGMPELLIRSSQRDLEGKDQWYYLLEQLAGPLAAIAGNAVVNGPTVIGQAANLVADSDNFDGDELTRAVEKVVPTFVRNVIKTGRYATDGVTTRNGDPVVDDLNPYQLLMQLQGFTPAEVAEQYKINNRLKNRERRITDKRQDIMRQIGDAVREGNPVPESALRKMREFNRDYPGWPITSNSIRQSVRSRQQASDRNEGGVSINKKLDGPLRESLAPAIY